MRSKKVRHNWVTFTFFSFRLSFEMLLESKNNSFLNVYYMSGIPLSSLHLLDPLNLTRTLWIRSIIISISQNRKRRPRRLRDLARFTQLPSSSLEWKTVFLISLQCQTAVNAQSTYLSMSSQLTVYNLFLIDLKYVLTHSTIFLCLKYKMKLRFNYIEGL